MGRITENKRRFLIRAVMDAEVKSVTEKVPGAGIFRPVFWAMNYPGTDHEGRLYVQHSPEHGCAIRASMIVEGTSREVSNYVFFGSRDDCVAWLQDESHEQVLIDTYNHLIEKADSLR